MRQLNDDEKLEFLELDTAMTVFLFTSGASLGAGIVCLVVDKFVVGHITNLSLLGVFGLMGWLASMQYRGYLKEKLNVFIGRVNK